MGYYTKILGEIKISPPIKSETPLPEINGLVYPHAEYEYCYETDRLIPDEEDRKAYYLISELQALVNAFPNHDFTGRLFCYGEDAGDIWGIAIVNRKVYRMTPKIIWPEDSDLEPGVV